MQMDFHYYATYCAAFIAGYSHEESLDIAYSAQFVDHCTRTLLAKIKGPSDAATTQMQLEMMDARTDPIGYNKDLVSLSFPAKGSVCRKGKVFQTIS